MKIIEPSVELINAPDYKTLLTTIEAAGRTCYKSEDKITDGSAEKFVRGIIKRGHEAVIEHGSLTVRFICDRGVSHEIVRHRLAAFCQESTRYCNYGKVPYIMAAGKDFVKDEMSLAAAEQICSRGTQTASKLFPDFPICVDDKFYFAGTSTKPKSSKSKTPCGG